MLIRYRTNSSCTLQNFKDDLDGLITGTVSTVAGLSSGVNKTASVIYGSYPSGTYTRVNGTTYTYSKVHNDATTSKTHYFRLTFDSTKLTTLTLAQSYTSGTDTLVNTYASTVNIVPTPYSVLKPFGIDILISNKMIAFFAPASGALVGILDLGHSTTTRTYTNSMLMGIQDFINVPGYGPNSTNVILANKGMVIPYSYNYENDVYSTIITGISGAQTKKKPAGPGTTRVFENPTFTLSDGAASLVYGMFTIPFLTFSGIQVYKDASNAYRLTVNDISLLVD